MIEMHFAEGEADRAVQLLVSVVERIKAKVGCQACWISRDGVEPRRIRYSEIWTSETVFSTHLRSEEFRHVLMALDMCSEKPTVTIGELTGRRGFEYLKELRGDSMPDTGQDGRPE